MSATRSSNRHKLRRPGGEPEREHAPRNEKVAVEHVDGDVELDVLVDLVGEDDDPRA